MTLVETDVTNFNVHWNTGNSDIYAYLSTLNFSSNIKTPLQRPETLKTFDVFYNITQFVSKATKTFKTVLIT